MEGHYTNVTQIIIKKEENIACLAAGELKQPHHTSMSFAQYDAVVLLKVRNINLWTISIRVCKPGYKSWSLHLNFYLPHPFRSFMNNCPPLINQLLILQHRWWLFRPTGYNCLTDPGPKRPVSWSTPYRRLYAPGNQASNNCRIHCLNISNLISFTLLSRMY